MTQSAQEALGILRDGGQFQWYVIPLLVLVVYVYANEIEKRNWDAVFAGLAFWGMDWFNEIWNGLFFHLSGYAPVWGAPGKTAFLILIGLNIEISFMFAIIGVVWVKTLPVDKSVKVFGIPNRIFCAIWGSAFCVFVEILLNAIGALTWEHAWWSAQAPWLIFLIGYFHFFVVCFLVYDMKKLKSKVLTVLSIFTVDASLLVIFGGVLNWL